MPDTQTLPAMIRAKFPGVYDDVSDADLDTKVRAKFPGVYDDIAKPQPKGEAHIGPARPNTALPPTVEGQREELWRGMGGNPVSPALREKLNAPLVHPTGIEAIDSLSSPVNLALTATLGAVPAATAFKGAVDGLAAKVGPSLTGKILKFVLPSMLKKPAELADILSEFGKLAAPAAEAPAGAVVEPVASHAAPPAAAPVASHAPTVPSRLAQSPVTPDMEAMADRLAGGANAASKGNGTFTAPPSTPVPAAPPPGFNLGQAMNDVRGAFRSVKVTPGPAEVNNAASLMKYGKTAEEAVARVIEQRPGVDLRAVAKLVKKLGAGAMTDEDVAAEIASRVGNRSPVRP